MKAKEAIDRLDPEKWAATTAAERLHLLEEVRENMKTYADELARGAPPPQDDDQEHRARECPLRWSTRAR